jgi:type I restriction enzyme, S subunit
MPSEWQETTLGEVATVRSGFAFKSSDWVEKGVPVVKISNVKEGRVVLDGCSYVTPEVATEADEYRLRTGDILVAMTGYIGDVALVRDDSRIMLNQRVGRFEVKRADLLDPLFLFYFLRLPGTRGELEGRGYGSAQPNISPDLIHAIEMPLPPLREQRFIARILGALDDRIELNRKMNETLEQMARAIFKSWFVDFEPFRNEGLVDSKLGKIPKGWEIKALGDVATVVKGRSYSSDELQPSKVALVTLKSFNRGGGYRVDGLKSFTGEYKPEQVVRPGEVVISFTDVTQAAEVIGRPAIVRASSDYDTLVASLDVGIIRPKQEVMPAPFFYCLLSTQDFTDHILSYVNGTTVLHLAKQGIPSYEFACPPPAVARAYAGFAVPAFARIDANETESRTLAAIRDALLPKLMSGEVRVAS